MYMYMGTCRMTHWQLHPSKKIYFIIIMLVQTALIGGSTAEEAAAVDAAVDAEEEEEEEEEAAAVYDEEEAYEALQIIEVLKSNQYVTKVVEKLAQERGIEGSSPYYMSQMNKTENQHGLFLLKAVQGVQDTARG